MCSGPRKPQSPPPIAEPSKSNPSLLLELAACNDLSSFKNALDLDDSSNAAIDAPSPWYCRSVGPPYKMGFADRTPLMIAALYGSLDVLRFVVSSGADVNRRSDFDGAAALHLAASGGAPSSFDAVKILVEASADPNSLELLKPRAVSPSTPRGDEEKKKEYPLDLTLPDIKNGIYGTDEFRMYTFKVKPCSRAYSHDWTECPFVHPGENARRRDPRKYLYSCVPCPEFRKGSCRNGDGCEYAHGVFECWLHPAQYRTRLCKDETGCNRRVCFFAHKKEELRLVNPTAASVGGLSMLQSPRSNLEMAAAAMMMGASTSPGSPLSPMMSQASAPVLQMPSSRLKSSLSARDLDVDFELLGIDGYRHKLLDEIQSANSPRANWAATAAAINSQNLTQQLISGYNGNLPSSPTLNSSSSSFGLDHSMAKAIMNSRSAAFAQRSQSFIDRGAVNAVNRLSGGFSASPTTTGMGLTSWGSPDGKLDWGIQGEELNKLRKSASFGFRNNQSLSPPRAPAPAEAFNEPDLSWVQSLVKDGEFMSSPWGEEQMVA